MESNSPDMLINHDTKILMQLVQAAMGKGDGVSIVLNSVNQLNIYLEGAKTQKINSPDQKLLISKEGGGHSGPSSRFTKEEIVKALEDVGWSKARAAEKLNVNRSSFSNYCRKFQINPPSGEWPDKRRRLS